MKTLMQLIKTVLDDAYEDINAPDEAAKDELIKHELKVLGLEYKALTDTSKTSIDYSEPLKRFAYIYKYTVAHADYIRGLIAGEPSLHSMLKQKEFSVACLGGGPGSDMLGVLKYLMQTNSKNVCFSCTMFDRERAWTDSWLHVSKVIKAPFQVHTTFAQMDVTLSDTWMAYKKALRADLYTLSYFLSEVWRIKDQAELFFDYCFSQIKSGAMVLFVDNNNVKFYGWFDELCKKHGLILVNSGKEILSFQNIEEKTDLGRYYTKFGFPKRESDSAWRIMRKP